MHGQNFLQSIESMREIRAVYALDCSIYTPNTAVKTAINNIQDGIICWESPSVVIENNHYQ
jgi:hypothetical protein